MLLNDRYTALMAQTSGEKKALETAFSLLVSAKALDEDCANRLKPHGLSEGGFAILVVLLEANGQLQPSQIAKKIGVTRATMTGLLDTLEKRGYIIRLNDAVDRRRFVVALSPYGRETAQTLKDTHSEWLTDLFSALSDQEQTTLLTLLNKIYVATDKGKNHETV